LEARGLNLIAVLDAERALDAAPGIGAGDGFDHVVLVASTGGDMWSSVVDGGWLDRDHPIDSHAAEALDAFEAGLRAAGIRSRRVWPPGPDAAGPPLPLSKLGEAAGWGRRSPLGLGIHPRYGLFVGYRGVVLVSGEWEERREPAAPHPCDGCSRPCVSACPVSAIGDRGIRAGPCFDERLRAGAACNDRCLARLACPVDGGRYPDAQIAHHQRFGNRLYHRWAATQTSP